MHPPVVIDTLLAKVVGTQNERELKRLRPIVAQVNALEPGVTALSDEQLRAKTAVWTEYAAAVFKVLETA